MSKIFAFNVLTNGIYGPIFAISAIVYEDGRETASFFERCPIEGKANMWLSREVMPYMNISEPTVASKEAMLRKFADFYLKNREHAKIVTYLGFNIETKLFGNMHTNHFIGDWDFPYPLIDVATILEKNGFNPLELIRCKPVQELYNRNFLTCCINDNLFKARCIALCYDYFEKTN